MERTAMVAALLLGVIASVDGLNCLSCSSTLGVALDSACLNAETTTSLASHQYPFCVTFGEYDSNKRLLQIARSPYYEMTNPDMANEECYQTTDLRGNTIYMIACACNDTDGCNNFIINNCRCEKPTNVWFGVNLLFLRFVIVLIALVIITVLFVLVFVIQRTQILSRYQAYLRSSPPRFNFSFRLPVPVTSKYPKTDDTDETKPFILITPP